MCLSKARGGLGFRNLTLFNIALLAKQSWRICQKPDSLLGRILKGRYFRSTNFLDAKTGAYPSCTWRSILCQDLFKKGFRWKIGSDSSINIKDDSWFSSRFYKKPLWILKSLKDAKVSSLIGEDGSWNESVI